MKPSGRTAALLVLPFVVLAIGSRVLVPVWGDWLARQIRFVALGLTLHPTVRRTAPVTAASVPLPPLEPGGPSASAPPIPLPNPAPVAKRSVATTAATPASGVASAAAPASARPLVPPPPGVLLIHAAKVQHAIDDAGRSIHARTTYGPDGKPMGARVTGVNGAGLGLLDGDIIVAVDGKPTVDDDAATDAALSVVARGDSVLHARLTRDGQPFEVTLELPLVPTDAGKNAR